MNMNGPGPMFTVIPIIVIAGFILVFGLILFTIIKGIGQWNRNNKQPILTVDARVVNKRTNVRTHQSAGEHSSVHSDTDYFVTFEVESGDRIEFEVSGEQSGLLIEGDGGRLTFQGTRFKQFQRSGGTRIAREGMEP